jgi:hypothetical protein
MAYTKNPCDRCGHSPDDHRFDDNRLTEFRGTPWSERPFRCLGPDLNGCDASCPSFVGEPLTWKLSAA